MEPREPAEVEKNCGGHPAVTQDSGLTGASPQIPYTPVVVHCRFVW